MKKKYNSKHIITMIIGICILISLSCYSPDSKLDSKIEATNKEHGNDSVIMPWLDSIIAFVSCHQTNYLSPDSFFIQNATYIFSSLDYSDSLVLKFRKGMMYEKKIFYKMTLSRKGNVIFNELINYHKGSWKFLMKCSDDGKYYYETIFDTLNQDVVEYDCSNTQENLEQFGYPVKFSIGKNDSITEIVLWHPDFSFKQIDCDSVKGINTIYLNSRLGLIGLALNETCKIAKSYFYIKKIESH
jgi:hypothetical protein